MSSNPPPPPVGENSNYPSYPNPPQQQGPPGYYPYVSARTTNGLAIASLVLGILWVYWVGSILALIFGYVARKQIRERNEGGDGMAIAGIVLGWIGVGTLLLLIGLVAFGRR